MGLSVHDPFVDPLGNPLGLAKTPGLLSINPIIEYFNTPGSGVFEIDPNKYSFFRVFIVGGGAGGYGSSTVSARRAGGGGGSSISKVIPVLGKTTIRYVVGRGGYVGESSDPNGGSSEAIFGSYAMLATGGGLVYGGTGSGGDLNFKGGAGSIGAGEPGGGGGVSADGDKGDTPTNSTGGGPGAGSGANAWGSYIKSNRGTDLVGLTPGNSLGGGEGGGGGGSANSGNRYPGGVGIVRIELW